MNCTSFGSTLRAHREAQGLSLDAVAKATKIKRSLLADLERDDLARWPVGIYRRGFVREYAKAIRFPAERVLEELCGLVPEACDAAGVAAHSDGGLGGSIASACDSSELRLALAGPPTPTARVVGARFAATAASLASVLAIGYVVTASTDVAFWTASGITALVWYPGHAMYGAARDALRRRRSRTRRSPEVTNSDHLEIRLSVNPLASDVDLAVVSPLRDATLDVASERRPTLH